MHHAVPGTLCRRRARRVARLAKGKDTGKDEARKEGVGYEWRSVRGEDYSIAEDALEEYVRWFDMPWE